MKYGRIHELQQAHPVAAMCRVWDASDARHSLPVVPNLPDRRDDSQPSLVTDITCIATDEGWLDLAGIKDLFNGALFKVAIPGELKWLNYVPT